MNRTKERFNFRRPEIINKTKREQVKRQYNFKPLKTIFYLIIFAACLYVVFFSNIFRIKQVEVEGVKSLEISDYIKQNLMGKNILLLQTGRFLRKTEKNFPILSELNMVRGLPGTVKVFLAERSQSMVMCNADSCYEIDNKGYAYQKTVKPRDKVVLVDEKNIAIKEGDRVLSDSFIYFFLSAVDELKGLGLSIASAKMDETTFKISFVTSEGWSIITDSSYSLKNQMSAVKQILEKNRPDIHEYIDVRVEGVAYLK
jgi:hypothetical protein